MSVSMRRAVLSPAQLARDLAIPDLSDPADGPHAIQLLAGLAVTALSAGSQVRWCRGPRLVPISDNYDALGYDQADVTRAARYSRYADGQRMLRSHATAMVPPALRRLAAETAPGRLPAEPADDVLLVCPGISYRRDAIDWQHTGTPHQLDLWRISTGRLGPADLDQMIAALLAALLPGLRSRQEPRRHPYTTGGRQIDVRSGRDWVEVWECGLAHPEVLVRAGLRGRTGLALGMGLDRLLMLRKGIPDIRLLRSADIRVASQMQDLAPYRPVSRQPAVRRDLSVAVDARTDVETLGDQVREALGPDADAVEDVRVLSSAGPAELPAAAAARLGLRPGQQNLLLRVTLRRLDRTLTDGEANALRDRIYAAVHQGGRAEWAVTRPAG